MKYLEILRAKRAEMVESRDAAIAEAEAIAEAVTVEQRSALTADEQASADEALARAAAADAELVVVDERIAELEKVAERAAKAAAAPTIMTRTPDASEPTDVRYLRPQEARDRALATLERSDSVSTPAGDKVDRLIRSADLNCRGDEIARRLIVTENDAYRSAFAKLMTQSQAVLTADEAEAVQRFQELRAASSTNASGGFGVPVLIDPTIILTAQESLNPFRRISRQVTITTNAWKGVSSAGVTWSYDAEAAAVSDDAPTLAQPSVSVHMARGFIPYSIEIGQDYPGFAAEMSRLLAEGYDELQSVSFVTGSGSGAPFGILTALDANTNVEVTPTTDGSFGAVDINKVWGALPDKYKANATWVMNHDVGNEVSSFSSSGMGSFYTVNLAQGNAPQLKGRPVEFSTHFPEFTGVTTAANILVVGDFRNYLIVDRAGMDVELVPHLFDVTNNRPTGERGWFAYARHGADSINDVAFRLLQNQ